MEAQLRTPRIVRAAMLVAAIAYVVVSEKLAKAHAAIPAAFYAAMIVVAGGSALLAIIFRNKFMPAAGAETPSKVLDAATVKRWMASYIVPYALAECVVLDGLVLRFAGAAFQQVVAFYVVGIALLLFLPPRLPQET